MVDVPLNVGVDEIFDDVIETFLELDLLVKRKVFDLSNIQFSQVWVEAKDKTADLIQDFQSIDNQVPKGRVGLRLG